MKSWLFVLYVLNCWFFGDQLCLTVHVHKLECLMKRLLCCIQSQGHSDGSELHICPDNISDQSDFAWQCIIISQCIIQKYHFAMCKVKATIIFTRSSEILKLFQPRLVWWYIITGQGKTMEKDFLLHRVWDREYGLGDCGLLPLLAIPISKAGSKSVPIKKMCKEHGFCNGCILVY